MKTLIAGLATLAALLSIAAGAAAPEKRSRAGLAVTVDGVDPASECVSDSDCPFELVQRPRDHRRAIATIEAMSATNGGRRFAGDRPLLTTISPNGDGVREQAAIRFRLTKAATVRLMIARTARRARVVYAQTRRLRAGSHTMYWAPPAAMPARTYLTFLEVRDSAGRTMYGTGNGDPARRQQTPVVRVLGVEAAFRGESFSPGKDAHLRVSADADRVTLQILRSGPERVVTRRNDELKGIAVTKPLSYDWSRRRNRSQMLRLRVGDWPTGVYFARLTTRDGRVGFAPFIVRPKRLGAHRAAVVLPTYTWQAYNLRDGDGNGWGETWYVHQAQRTVALGRPQLDRGVPMAFRVYDLPFLHWLAWHDRPVDYLAQSDVAGSSGRALRAAYDLLIFPGHHEYVTRREYTAVTGFRDRGGSLMFLSANNFFWRVDRDGNRLRRIAMWRDLGWPEAALIGVQYVGNGRQRGPYTVRDVGANSWVFAGMGISKGSKLGHFGIEIDKTTSSSPAGTRVLAEIPNLLKRGLSAQMTYYETVAGAKVFAAGAFTLAGSATRPYGTKLLNNLWRHMTAERPSSALTFASAGGGRPLEAAFARESYRPGVHALLRVSLRTERLSVQIFRTGPERRPTRRNDEMNGVPVSEPTQYAGGGRLNMRIGNWPTGVYFAKITARGGGLAFAPFIVRPRRIGLHRVAVVLPTNTWQAYNFRDDDGDGAADTWYADRSRRIVRMARPFLHRGVPMRFRAYDLPFLHWLAWKGRPVDYFAQSDLERMSNARALRRAYDLIVFPGHHEYVTAREFDLVTHYRNLGGNLAFLSANNFFWKVERRGDLLYRVAMWRDIGRPEAALVGVQYVAYGSELRGPYQVRSTGGASWLFDGTGMRAGSRFGTFGIEIDRTTPASPRGTRVLAEIRTGQELAKAGQMTYYRTRSGAKVFAAGAFTLAGSATRAYGAKLLDNLWRYFIQG